MTLPIGISPFVDPADGRSLNDLDAATTLADSDRVYLLQGADQDRSATIAQIKVSLGAGLTFTPGSVLFAGPDGISSQDNANLFWNDSLNAMGIGAAPAAGMKVRVGGQLTGATSTSAVIANPEIRSDVIANSLLFVTNPSTQAAAFTLPLLTHYATGQGTIGAGSAITEQRAFAAAGTLAGATVNRGFFGNVPAAPNNANFFANSAANNYFVGAVRIGSTVAPVAALDVVGAITATAPVTAPSFVPNAATIPTNGMYLGAPNLLAWATNSTAVMSIGTTGILSVGGISTPGSITATGAVSAGNVAVTAATIPANGMYLPSANTIAWATNMTGKMSLNATGDLSVGGKISGYVLQSQAFTVATLPSAAAMGPGARAAVTDATTANFGTVPVGGGAVNVPVYTAGTAWVIG